LSGGGKDAKNSLLGRYILSYLIALFIPLVFGSLIYREAIGIVEADTRKASLAILEQSRDVLDRQLMEIDKIIAQIAINPRVNHMLYTNKDPVYSEVYGLNELERDLEFYTISNNLITDAYVFFNQPGIVVSSRTIYGSFESFYGYHFRYPGMDFGGWSRTVLNKYHYKEFIPASTAVISGKSYPVITYMHSVPLGSGNYFKGTICILLDQNDIDKLLYQFQSDDGWAYIADASGTILTSRVQGPYTMENVSPRGTVGELVSTRTISGESMTILQTKSRESGLIFVSAIPSRIVMAKVGHIRQITIKTMFGILGLGLIAAFFMGYRNSKPLKDIIRVLHEKTGADAVLPDEPLPNSISRLIDNNQTLSRAVQEQKPLLRTAFFNALLKGEFASLSEIQANMANTGLAINAPCYAIAMFRLSKYDGIVAWDTLEELKLSRAALKEILDTLLLEKAFLHSLDEDKAALLFCSESEDRALFTAHIEGIINKAWEELHNRYGIQLFSAIGCMFDNLLYASRSMNEANQALEYRMLMPGSRLVWYRDTLNNEECFYYPIELEQKLLNLSKAGEREELYKLLDHIFNENISRRRLSALMLRNLMEVMKGTVIKLADHLPFERRVLVSLLEMPGPQSFESLKAFRSFLTEKYKVICDTAQAEKNSRNKKFIGEILQLIELEYKNPSLSQTLVADRFGITEAYLSRFFKEQTGENYSAYIERIRIEHACSELLCTNISVEEVAGRCGYYNDTSFRRAFKRLTGVSPSSYREHEKTKPAAG